MASTSQDFLQDHSLSRWKIYRSVCYQFQGISLTSNPLQFDRTRMSSQSQEPYHQDQHFLCMPKRYSHKLFAIISHPY